MSETFEKISAVLDGEAAPDGGDLKVQRWHPQKTPIGTIVKPHSEGDFVTLEDHRAHVTRLQAENAALQQRLNVADQQNDELTAENARLRAESDDALFVLAEKIVAAEKERETLQSDLTKARELLEEAIIVLRAEDIHNLPREIDEFLAHQSAPAAKDEKDPRCCCPPKGYCALWAAGPCPIHMGLRSPAAKPCQQPQAHPARCGCEQELKP